VVTDKIPLILTLSRSFLTGEGMMFVSSLRPRTPGAGEGLGMRAPPKKKAPHLDPKI